MKLLRESKGIWLSSYLICTCIIGILFFVGNNLITRTIMFIFLNVQVIILLYVLCVLVYKCKAINRIFFLGLHLAFVVCECVHGYVCKWYVIVPFFLMCSIYLIWYLGGINNCIEASKYKSVLDEQVQECKCLYDSYIIEIYDYNERKKLKGLNKIHIKKEPCWSRLQFNLSGRDMFFFWYALFGINTSRLNRKLLVVEKIKNRLKDKLKALNVVKSGYEEEILLREIIFEMKDVDLSEDLETCSQTLSMYNEKNARVLKYILKERL